MFKAMGVRLIERTDNVKVVGFYIYCLSFLVELFEIFKKKRENGIM
jgi:hypothetical protein